jgi:membrane-bound serine protease (ClpP class)
VIAVGVALVLVGAALLVAEAHVPSGFLGVAGTCALAAGAALAISAAGGGIAIAVTAVLAAASVGGLWLTLVARKALASQGLRAQAGSEAIAGHLGVVRNWSGKDGQVLVDGALWRARRSWADEEGALGEGDPVVVERVSGLTLAVRKAEDWEEPC